MPIQSVHPIFQNKILEIQMKQYATFLLLYFLFNSCSPVESQSHVSSSHPSEAYALNSYIMKDYKNLIDKNSKALEIKYRSIYLGPASTDQNTADSDKILMYTDDVKKYRSKLGKESYLKFVQCGSYGHDAGILNKISDDIADCNIVNKVDEDVELRFKFAAYNIKKGEICSGDLKRDQSCNIHQIIEARKTGMFRMQNTPAIYVDTRPIEEGEYLYMLTARHIGKNFVNSAIIPSPYFQNKTKIPVFGAEVRKFTEEDAKNRKEWQRCSYKEQFHCTISQKVGIHIMGSDKTSPKEYVNLIDLTSDWYNKPNEVRARRAGMVFIGGASIATGGTLAVQAGGAIAAGGLSKAALAFKSYEFFAGFTSTAYGFSQIFDAETFYNDNKEKLEGTHLGASLGTLLYLSDIAPWVNLPYLGLDLSKAMQQTYARSCFLTVANTRAGFALNTTTIDPLTKEIDKTIKKHEAELYELYRLRDEEYDKKIEELFREEIVINLKEKWNIHPREQFLD